MFNGGGRGGRSNAKAKNFGAAIKRIFFEMKGFYLAMSIAAIMTITSSIFTVIAPDKLAQITDEISSGIMIDRENMETTIGLLLADPTTDTITEENKVVTVAEKAQLAALIQEVMGEAAEYTDQAATARKLYAKIDELPESIKDLILPKMNYSAIQQAALVMAGLYIVSAILEYGVGWIMAAVTSGFSRKLRNRISEKINRLPLSYFDKHQIGDILSRVTNDVDSVTSSLDSTVSTFANDGAKLIAAIVMMFYTNWTLALVAIFSSLFGFVFIALILSKSQKYFTDRQVELGHMNSHIEEIYSGIAVVKVYGGKRSADRKFDSINHKIRTANQRSQFLSGLMHPFMAFIGNFGYVAICVVGALLAANGAITFGVIIAFISYARLFSSPLSRIAQGIGGLQPAAASSERVFEFLDEEEMPSEKDLVPLLERNAVKGDIEFDNVKFSYDDDKLIIKGFSAKAKPGQKVAIVGPTGAGKTTMVNLLMKFYDIKSGDIRIDGKSTKQMSRHEIRSLFTMVLQDTWMFSGTIRDNIVYNHSAISDAEIMKVCDTVGLSHFIKTLPDGLRTEVGENDSISAGQKQLITIARGMIEDAPFLILDEATSNVDTRTEELVQQAMDKLMEGRTSFIIAHRLSTIKNADLILVMRDGNIIETGNHHELMKQNGFYANLYNSQFIKEKSATL